MKKLWTLAFCLLLPAAFIACGKKDNKDAEQAGAPANTCLVQNCDGSEYSNYSGYGFAQYNKSTWNGYSYFGALQMQSYSWGGYNQWGYFCGCSQGTTPVYNAVRGLGCVNNMYIQQYGQNVVFWTIPNNTQQFASFPSSQAMSYVSSYNNYNSFYNMNGNCVQFVAESCYVNQSGGCREGATCRPTIQGSAMGICSH